MQGLSAEFAVNVRRSQSRKRGTFSVAVDTAVPGGEEQGLAMSSKWGKSTAETRFRALGVTGSSVRQARQENVDLD